MLNRFVIFLLFIPTLVIATSMIALATYSAYLVDNNNGTIHDLVTGLIWQKSEGDSMRWDDAISYCDELRLTEKKDWRLPNINELRSLVDGSLFNPALDRVKFPEVRASLYWSSTTSPSRNEFAWFVSFMLGNANSYKKNQSYFVRCVRGGY
jgi:hypothetical protein